MLLRYVFALAALWRKIILRGCKNSFMRKILGKLVKYSRKRVRCRCKKFRFEFERVLKISILEFRKIEKFCVHLKCF